MSENLGALLTVLSDPEAAQKLLAQKQAADAAKADADNSLRVARQTLREVMQREERLAKDRADLERAEAEHKSAAATLAGEVAAHKAKVESFNNLRDEIRARLP